MHGSNKMKRPTILKNYLSVFKQMPSEQVDWKRCFLSIAFKTTRTDTIEIFTLGLCEEYPLSGENC
jgi:hypothetical protein